MAINSKAVKKFWENRAKKIDLKIESTNLGLTSIKEKKLKDLKIKTEWKKVNKYLTLNKQSIILDLGGGYGEWAFKFAKKCKKVYIIDYAEGMIQKGLQEAKIKKITNIKFIHAPVQKFKTSLKFDIIFISGLMIYLNNKEINELLKNIKKYSKPNTTIILRDGTGINKKFEIKNKFSKALKAKYNAIYRTREEYIILFKKIGFNLIKDEDMFGKKSKLNKFSETRLRIYKFIKNG